MKPVRSPPGRAGSPQQVWSQRGGCDPWGEWDLRAPAGLQRMRRMIAIGTCAVGDSMVEPLWVEPATVLRSATDGRDRPRRPVPLALALLASLVIAAQAAAQAAGGGGAPARVEQRDHPTGRRPSR